MLHEVEAAVGLCRHEVRFRRAGPHATGGVDFQQVLILVMAVMAEIDVVVFLLTIARFQRSRLSLA